MTDREALYRAVLDNPDDDTPRLVYADWLDDHGDPDYARFIRAQIELARVPEWDPLWLRAWETERRLVTGLPFRERFPLPLETPSGYPTTAARFRRGFPWEVGDFTPGQFAERAADLLAVAPIQAVKLTSSYRAPPPDIGPLADCPHLARLRRLTVNLARLPADAVRRLAGSSHAAGLTDLGFEFAGIAADGVEALFRSPLLPRLTRLRFRSNDAAVDRAVRAAGGPFRLRGLTAIPSHPLRVDVVGLLAAPLLRGLVELDLSEFRLGPDGFAALAASPAVNGLESLTLWKTAPGVPGVRALAGSPAVAGLRQLSLRSCGLGPVAVKALAASPHLGNLVDLDLAGNAIGEAGAVALAESPYLRNLVRLEIGEGIGDRGLLALLDSPIAAGLIRLSADLHSGKTPVSEAVKKRFFGRFGGCNP